MLKVFDVDEESEALYARLLAQGVVPIEKLAEHTPIEQIEKRLAELHDVGLAVREVNGWWQAVPLPDALRALRARRVAELDALVASADAAQTRLLALADDGGSGLRSLIGREAVQSAMNDISTRARFEICGFDKPPYVTTRPPTKEWLEQNSAEYQALMRGVRIRSVYHPGFDENRLAEMALFHDQGERARTGDVPMKLVVVDAAVAFTPAPASYAPDQETRATLVHHPIMVEALQSLFEAVWHRSLPIDTTSHGVFTDPRRDLLVSLLMSGATDVAIANQLGVTERSVRRWISTLMEELEVQTRLQLGAALARTEALRNDSRRLSAPEPE
jgi:hypothetical protein